MQPFGRLQLVGSVLAAAVAIAAVLGVEPTAASTLPLATGVETITLQLFDTIIEILDRIADLLNQINRVVSEFSQLFGEGGGGGEGGD